MYIWEDLKEWFPKWSKLGGKKNWGHQLKVGVQKTKIGKRQKSTIQHKKIEGKRGKEIAQNGDKEKRRKIEYKMAKNILNGQKSKQKHRKTSKKIKKDKGKN